MFIELTDDEWEETYKPIPNPYTKQGSFNNTMFETFGQELDFVKTQNPLNIWTWCDGGGYSVISNGYHYVDRMGYFVTAIPFDDSNEYQIDIYMPDECETTGIHLIDPEGTYPSCDYCGRSQEDIDEDE